MSLEGKPAPDFTLVRDGGDDITLSSLRPSMVIVYFYPKDDTAGCTTQAVNFTERQSDFADAGAVIIGISTDTVAKHEKFIAKHDLGVILASDADSDVCERYGTWVEKSMYGKKYMGIERSTFLIGGDGKVLKEWRKVKVPGHVDAVLEAVRGA